MATLLSFGEWSRVNHVNGAVLIQDEHDLKQAAAAAPAPNEPLVVRPPQRKGRVCSRYDSLRFLGIHAVPRRVLQVPLVPPEVHELITYGLK
jgi:hypothetical protein